MKKVEKRPYIMRNKNGKNDINAVERRNCRLLAFASAYIVMMIKYGPEKGTEEAGKLFKISKPAAYNWLKTDVVREEIKKKTTEVALKYHRTPDDCLSELSEIAYSNIIDFFEPDGDGIKLKKLHDIPGKCRIIKNIDQTQTITESTFNDVTTKITTNKFKYEMYSKLEALKVLAQFHRLINARQNDVANTNTGPRVIVYLPDNGFGDNKPVSGVRFGRPEEIPYEEVE